MSLSAPPEILFKIFLFFNGEELDCRRRVCSLWNTIICRNMGIVDSKVNIWKYLFLQLFHPNNTYVRRCKYSDPHQLVILLTNSSLQHVHLSNWNPSAPQLVKTDLDFSDGDENMMYNQPCWSPDGNFLACIFHNRNSHKNSSILIKRMKPLDNNFKLKKEMIGRDVLRIATKTIPFYLYWSNDSTHLSWLSNCPQDDPPKDEPSPITFWIVNVFETLRQHAMAETEHTSFDTIFQFYDTIAPESVALKQMKHYTDYGIPFYYSFHPLPLYKPIAYESTHPNFWSQDYCSSFSNMAIHKKHKNEVYCYNYAKSTVLPNYITCKQSSANTSYYDTPILLPNNLIAYFELTTQQSVFKIVNTETKQIIFEMNVGDIDTGSIICNSKGNIVVVGCYENSPATTQLYAVYLYRNPKVYQLIVRASSFFMVKDCIVMIEANNVNSATYYWEEQMETEEEEQNKNQVIVVQKSRMERIGVRISHPFIERNYYQFFAQYHMSHYYGSYDGTFFVTAGNRVSMFQQAIGCPIWLMDLQTKQQFQIMQGKYAIFHPPVQKL